MAEAVVSIAAAIALEQLTRFAEENARFLSGVSDQVEEIRTELKRMQFFLKDADSRNHTDQSVHNWLREIKLLAYKAEDIIESYAVVVASNRKRGVRKVLKRFACIFCEARSLRNLGLQIAKVKTEISDITTSLQRYDIRAIGGGESSSAGNENQWWERQTYAHQVEEHFVGMEEDTKNLVSLVLDDDKRHRVISIWGMGGIGKTTLARMIYKHKDVQQLFGRFAWVCITQHAQIKVILQDILMQLAPEKLREVNCMGNRELVQQIYLVQKATKCLIVLDDIWKAEDWKTLVAAFPIPEGDSKILLTTRDEKIAEIGFPYALKCLSEMESWELLQKIASTTENFKESKIDRDLEDIGIEMVRKCGCLPLAISVLGEILKDKNSLVEWQMVNKHVHSYLGNTEDDKKVEGAVARVLSLSYDNLPYYLKPCFLYLGSFQEDEDIEFAKLHMLWEAEGMILSQHRRGDERSIDIAERYLDELARRSMVQVKPVETTRTRKSLSCSLHDMMRDLCLEKGMEEEFCKVVDFRGVRQFSLNPSSSIDSSYRLVIQMDVETQNSAAKTITHAQQKRQLRSLRCLNLNSTLGGKDMIWPQGIVNFEESKSLRVLQFEGYDFRGKKLPVDFRKLIHLRYLDFNNCKLDELPSSVAELPLLHTLYLQVNNDVKVPNVLWKMKNLRHLYLFANGRYTVQGKLRLHGLDELEALYGVDSRVDEISDLANLSNLQTLMVRVCDNNSLRSIIDYFNMKGLKLKETFLCIDGCDFSSLNEGHLLLRNVLMCDKLLYMGLVVKMSKFPSYEPGILENLTGLNLEGNELEEDPIAALEMLPQLRFLLLGPNAYIGKCMTFHEWGFPHLIILWLSELPNLECWRVDKGAMPKLCSLMILGCQKLEMIPAGLKFVVSLIELAIYQMPGKFCERIKKDTGEDYDKIQHVPLISVDRPFRFHSGKSPSFWYNVINFMGSKYKFNLDYCYFSRE